MHTGRISSPAPTARRVLLSLWRLQVFGVDPVQRVELAAARGEPAVLRGAEPAQVQIGNAALVEAGGELVLGKAGTARGSDARTSTNSFTPACSSSSSTDLAGVCS